MSNPFPANVRAWGSKVKKIDVYTCMSIRIPKTQLSLLIYACTKRLCNVLNVEVKVEITDPLQRPLWMMQFSSWMKADGVPGEGWTSFFLLCCRRPICYLSNNRGQANTGLGSDISGYIMTHVGLGQRCTVYLWIFVFSAQCQSCSGGVCTCTDMDQVCWSFFVSPFMCIHFAI